MPIEYVYRRGERYGLLPGQDQDRQAQVCVCPADRVLDGHGPMASERRALSWPKASRAIRAKNNSGVGGSNSGSRVG